MKKSAALTFAVFYMLLTTGMFVCIMHCASQMLLSKAGVVASQTRSSKGGMNDCCHAKKSCDCCKKHGNYEVKENIKPGVEYAFAVTSLAVEPVANVYAPIDVAPAINTHKYVVTEPPWKTGRQRSIQLRSLQI